MINLDELKEKISTDIKTVADNDQLSAFWQKYLGKSGAVSGLMKEMKDLSKEAEEGIR